MERVLTDEKLENIMCFLRSAMDHFQESWQYLEKVLDMFRVIAVAFPTDPLHFFDLARLACGLDVLEMHLWVLAEVHNRAKEVEQTCIQHRTTNEA